MPCPQTFINGDWNAICDSCGRQYKASSLLQRWDGLMVCRGDWEPRQPQDFVRGVADKQVPPWTRPEGPDNFIFSINFGTIFELLSYANATINTTVIPYTSSKQELNSSFINSKPLG